MGKNLLNKSHAWIELFKLGAVRSLNDSVKKFYRTSILQGLKEEGWFDFLSVPRKVDDIANHFHYSDRKLLDAVLDTLVEDHTLVNVIDHEYIVDKVPELDLTLPKVFQESTAEVTFSLGRGLPDRLRGIYHDFSGGLDLYNWDDALTQKLYIQLRKGAFAYSGAGRKEGSFLDVGCGNGFSTAATWGMYFKHSRFYPGTSMKVIGIEPDPNLLTIAREEFPRWASKHLNIPQQDLFAMKEYFPEFIAGKAEELPFASGSFDIVYTSATLHWTNAEQAIREMVRVTKPGGLIFGTVRMFPHADMFPHFHTQVVKGATGFFYKEDFIRWALAAGAQTPKFATMVSFFKMTK